MKKIAVFVFAIILCLYSSCCVLAGDGGELPDIEEAKEQNGSYFDKEQQEEYAPPVQPEFKSEAPEEDERVVLNGKTKRTLLGIGFITLLDILLCLCSAIIIPVLSASVNFDDIYTLRSGAYWIVHVKFTPDRKILNTILISK